MLLERLDDAAAVVAEDDAGADRSDARLPGEVLHPPADRGAVGGRDVHVKSSAHPRENSCNPCGSPRTCSEKCVMLSCRARHRVTPISGSYRWRLR